MRDYCWLTNIVVVRPLCIMNKVPLGKVVLYLASVSSTYLYHLGNYKLFNFANIV